MTYNKENISLFIGVAGFLLSFYGLIENKLYILLFGVSSYIVAICFAFKLTKEKQRYSKANIEIEGHRIESLNLANITRKQNKTFFIQQAKHIATIRGLDLVLEFDYSGYCSKGSQESGIDFSVDSDVNIEFRDIQLYGFDLINDPNRLHKIKPFLTGSEGMTKKIKLPFMSPIKKGEAFHVSLISHLHNCMKYGKDYITATLSFGDSLRVADFSVELVFVNDHPNWVRVYDTTTGNTQLLKNLSPSSSNEERVIYNDHYKDMNSKTALVYFFER